ncbi:MAG TPA: DivIVA domain-containing protein [Candidatus Scatomorpha pullistercoris]|uniref:DivIVA domain-containing protein n=1 Tax=Candidatus Scatomorpha pullistercoris TaxID=2840929 RepID=A0A9D1G692_9FIRM|nr:DivIVA domain-containing protein [Candidatus Scatomorpha pullistercoris]
MTPQDIREKTFEKAMFGGYDMGGVDDFMEEAAAELESAQRENATLRAKMKVLVDKIEEYRASEDAMRMTLMSAQKLSSQIEAEARAKADKLVAEAQATASRSLEALKAETVKEQAKLREAKEAFNRFFEDAKSVCVRQLESLERISKSAAPAKQEEAVDATVKSIEDSVARIPDEPAPKIDISPVMGETAPRETITPEEITRLFNMGGN